ncbi:MAG: acetyl-CoA carboxylase biotin carboxyl carrier protein [Candidatus Azotimanducaceae bacterium]|jgi:acetyl-CoA carboxylase biotin carboxyl carrier protein
MDIRKVKKLIELMEDADLTEIEIKEGEDTVRISRASVFTGPSGFNEKGSLLAKQTERQAERTMPSDEELIGHIVSAPMVGTFYQSPAPESPAFVNVGSKVEIGDTLCIIESMKMMNQITSDQSGIIEAILVKNEGLVEYDQALFTIV